MHVFTERCTIRDFEIKDIDCFIEYRNNMVWMKYQGYKGRSKETYKKELLQEKPIEAGKQYAIVDTATQQLIGDIYLKQVNDTYWLGYTINPHFARQGYASEAITAISNWAREQGVSMIKAGVLPDNIASLNLLKKLCFLYIGKENDEMIYVLKL